MFCQIYSVIKSLSQGSIGSRAFPSYIRERTLNIRGRVWVPANDMDLRILCKFQLMKISFNQALNATNIC